MSRWFTDTTTGLRIPLTVDEIARNEMINLMVYAGMRNAMAALKPGVTEAEISGKLNYDGRLPLSCHIVVSFGDNVGLALNSPTNNELRLGDPLSVALGVWGANMARTGIAVHSEDEFSRDRRRHGKGIRALFRYAALSMERCMWVLSAGDVYEVVRDYMEDPFFRLP